MFKKILFFFFSLIIFSGSARLQDTAPQNPILSKYFFKVTDQKSLDEIANKYEILHREKNGFEVLVPVPEVKNFLQLAPEAELREYDISYRLKHLSKEERAGFHNFETVRTHLEKLVTTYPELASMDTYGKSMEGRALYSLRLLSKVSKRNKPQIVITSSTHGNEIITVEVVFGILEYLLTNYGKNERVTHLVDSHEIYFLPVINPDGYVRNERYANGVDPNREYPWPEKPERNPNPCIKAVMNFFQNHDVKGSIDYHSTGGMIMYPWAYTYQEIPNPEKSELHTITGKMAQWNHYAYGPISKVIYVAKGSSADYYYWKFGTRALGIEVSQDGSPSLIPSMLQENLESTLTFIENF